MADRLPLVLLGEQAPGNVERIEAWMMSGLAELQAKDAEIRRLRDALLDVRRQWSECQRLDAALAERMAEIARKALNA